MTVKTITRSAKLRTRALAVTFLVLAVSTVSSMAFSQDDDPYDFLLERNWGFQDGKLSDVCAHDVCYEGAPLEEGCSGCVTQICTSGYIDCCTVEWNAECVAQTALYPQCKPCSTINSNSLF